MEPFTAGAIATLVLTKAIEKTGDKLGEKVLELGGDLMVKLQRKSPDTAKAIQVAAQQPELMQQQPETYSIPVLEAQVVEAAQSDTEIAVAIQALADAFRSQPQANTIIEKWKGINIKGGNPTISNNTFNF
jgi:ABC-type molybdate transport system ATPase subunit